MTAPRPPKQEAAPAPAPPKEEAKPAAPAPTVQSTPPSVGVGPSAAAPEARSQVQPEPQATSAGPYPIEPPPTDSAPPTAQADGDTDQGPLSPLVRKMAREYNIDLSKVNGTGAGNRITKQDIEAYMSAQAAQTYSAAAAPAPPSAPAAPPPPPPAPSAAPPAAAPLPLAETAKIRSEPMSTMRQKIAEHMINSKRTSAHVTTVHKVDMTKIAKLRDKAKGEFHSRNGFSLTFLPFVAAATAEALRVFPIFNASIDGKNIVYYRDINLGIAVALEGGLIVPVIRDCRRKERSRTAALHRRFGNPSPFPSAQAGRSPGRYLLHYQLRQLWQHICYSGY